MKFFYCFHSFCLSISSSSVCEQMKFHSFMLAATNCIIMLSSIKRIKNEKKLFQWKRWYKIQSKNENEEKDARMDHSTTALSPLQTDYNRVFSPFFLFKGKTFIFVPISFHSFLIKFISAVKMNKRMASDLFISWLWNSNTFCWDPINFLYHLFTSSLFQFPFISF